MEKTIDKEAERIAALRAVLEIHDAQELVNDIITRVQGLKARGVPLSVMLDGIMTESVRPVGDTLLLVGVAVGAYGELKLI
ncbi:MAG TPA: hypothetical protein VHC90_11040 [Bryobacteraceae bacterium]|nr:hypothetical protein [Bryobacteraceae bacterium]